MGKLILFFFFAFTSLLGWTQSLSTIVLDKAAREVQTDVFGNAYVILDDGAIQKYSAQGILIAHFRESGWGIPSQLDVLNPLNPIVFYSGKGFVQEFDNNLTPIFQLNLEGGFTRASLVARSSDGNFWWFRERDRTLVKINRAGQILLEGTTLDFLGTPQSLLPTFLFETIEKNGIKVQLYDPQSGLYTFGANAQFLLRRADVRMDAWFRCGKNWGFSSGEKSFSGEAFSNTPLTKPLCSDRWKLVGNRLRKDE